VRRWLQDLPLRPKLRLIVCTLAAAGVFMIGIVYGTLQVRGVVQNANQRIATEAHATAYAAAVALDAYDHVLVSRAVDALAADQDVRSATVKDQAGRVLAGRRVATSGASSSNWTAIVARLTSSTLDVPVPTTDDTGVSLHVELNLEREMAVALRNCVVFLLASIFIAALIGTVCLALLARTLRRPLVALMRNLREMRASGDYSRRFEKRGNDEFGQLVDEINEMLAERDGSDRNLRAYKKEFDRRVRERTQELDVAVAEAREAAKRAQGASRAKSDFLARMSHEIRTPLNGVMGMAELLRHSSTLDDLHRRYAVVIHQSGKALLQLINDILDFSKIEAGKLELEKGRFCLREMIEDALEILAERAQSKGLELICDIPYQLDTVVYGDCLRLRQVIINLVSNAVKFTERGDITIKLRAGAGIETATFTFEVTDTGIGIRPENCANIFESFVQEDTSTSRRYGGTGLGLAICKQLVELMSGTIGVNSTVGVGSTFRFSVPLPVDRSAPKEKPSTLLATTRVLLVEKNPAASSMLAQHLRSWGAIPSEVDSAVNALKRLEGAFAGEFDVLILDDRLPQTTPTAMVAAVRGIPAFHDMPILLLHTGAGEVPAELRALPAPVAVQSKPIRRSHLKGALEGLVANIRDAWQPPQSKETIEDRHVPKKVKARARRVLLVEDNPVNQEVARAMLQNLSVTVDSASSGKEALEKLALARYDVILMDCQMPDMDGYVTTQRYREWELLEGRARTPIVALTANALAGDPEKCIDAGMDHYLSKPFTIEQLRGVLEEHALSGEQGPQETQSVLEVLDSKTVEQIRSLAPGGQSDLFVRLAGLYRTSSAALIDTLAAANRTADAAGIAQAAHALKSSSANIGALRLASTCAELETAARKDQRELTGDLVERLLGEHQDVVRELERNHLAA
jgi:two-component system, sensor histidine kinase and response regulator